MKLLSVRVESWLEKTLPRIRRSSLLSFVLALCFFAVAVAIQLALHDIHPDGLPFITFFPAILLATLFGGGLAGAFVLILSLSASWYFLLPHFASREQTTETVTAVGLFALFGLMIVLITHLLNITVERLVNERRRAEDYLHTSALAEQQLQQLNHELRHRNKNTFAIISSLIGQSARHAQDVQMLVDELRGRLSAMGAAQDLVLSTRMRVADLNELISQIIRPIVPPGDKRVSVSGPRFHLPTELATPIALVLHELATNCLKYGAWSNAKGRVDINWDLETPVEDTHIVLRWRERGGPPVSKPMRSGLGSVLIEKGVPGAEIERTFAASGLVCTISVKVENVNTARTGVRSSTERISPIDA